MSLTIRLRQSRPPCRAAVRGGRRSQLRLVCAQGFKDVCELKLCNAKACRRQGSAEVLRFGQDLELADVRVTETTCLGNCGQGPNGQALPWGSVVGHLATPAALVEALKLRYKVEVPPTMLQATQLRLAGNALAASGDLAGAVSCYSQGLGLEAPRARSALLAARSAALLKQQKVAEALVDAKAAVACASPGYALPQIRLAEALRAAGDDSGARKALEAAVAADAAAAKTPEFMAAADAQAAIKV